jgi:hypothetical protein
MMMILIHDDDTDEHDGHFPIPFQPRAVTTQAKNEGSMLAAYQNAT